MTRTIFIAAAIALVATLPAVPAHAQAARTFVSAAGLDTNNCTNVATPCRHLAAAFAATGANGEIYVLDPANYGSLTINHAVSIEGHGWASIAPVSGQAAITITASPGDKINIIGVVLDGTAIGNTTGIRFNSGGSLTVRDSVIRNFGNEGITFAPTGGNSTQLLVSSTLVSDNSNTGIHIVPTGTASVAAVLNQIEIANTGTGLSAENSGGLVNVMVRNSTIVNNINIGLSSSGVLTMLWLSRSTITENGAAWSVPLDGRIFTYGDNIIDGNVSANAEPSNPLTYH